MPFLVRVIGITILAGTIMTSVLRQAVTAGSNNPEMNPCLESLQNGENQEGA